MKNEFKNNKIRFEGNASRKQSFSFSPSVLQGLSNLFSYKAQRLLCKTRRDSHVPCLPYQFIFSFKGFINILIASKTHVVHEM